VLVAPLMSRAAAQVAQLLPSAKKKCLDQVLVAPLTLRAAALVALVLPLIKSGLLRERLVAFNATSSGVEPMGCSVTLENK
jgi:hypothetical protein